MSYFTPYKEHYKALIRLGIPIVIGQIGIVVVGLADNMMVGQYATLDLAAASFVNSAFNIPILFGLGFSYGLTPLVGQFFGRHDKYHVGQLLRNSLLVNLFIGLLLTLAMTVVWFNIDRLGQPEELLPLIRPYFLLQLASLVFVMLFNSFKQFADGITDTKTPMYIMISGEYCRKLYTDLRKIRTTGPGCRRSRHFHLNGPYPHVCSFRRLILPQPPLPPLSGRLQTG